MIAIDTNVLLRYLVRDDEQQAQIARKLLESLSVSRPGYVCREVTLELVWVLKKAYGFSKQQIATALEDLACAKHLVFENVSDVLHTVHVFRKCGTDFSDLMIVAAAKRAGALPLYTFDRRAARLKGARLL